MLRIKNNLLLLIILLIALIIRIVQIDKVPVALFGDEIDIGYQAYSLLKTGRDYSGNLLPISLESLADHKAPLYAYTLIPFIAISGINEFSVRIPSAIFGVINIFLFYLLISYITKNKTLGLISAGLITISPWHIHYSRWGFEGTLMILLFLLGTLSFFKSFEKNKFLFLSALCLGLSIWAYHAAKVFLPSILFVMLILYGKELIKFPRKYLITSLVIFMVIIAPVIKDSFFGEGSDRYGSLSLFSDPVMEGEIGFSRNQDKYMYSHESSFFSTLKVPEKLFHNKFLFVLDKITTNYLHAYSPEFLFLHGDPNPRHSVQLNGEFYRIDFIFILIGLVAFFAKPFNTKIKIFLLAWLLLAPLPAVITLDGGSHASRLLFMLPPLIFLSAVGVYYSLMYISGKKKPYFVVVVAIIYLLSFIFYSHNYWIHYPMDSQRWWQYGYKQSVQEALKLSKDYNKVIISSANEPALIFYLGWSQYPPDKFFQQRFNKGDLEGFGSGLILDKFFFPEIGFGRDLYSLGSVLPEDALYVATFKEINLNLITEPERVPGDIRLVETITYPSGEPALYLFDKKGKK